MCGTSANNAFEQIVERLAAADSLLLVTHARSDGDALGSILALARAAEGAGKTARLLVPDQPPPRYGFLLGERPVASGGQFAALGDAADLVVIVDTCALGQLEGLEDAIAARRDKIVVVDHHATADDIASVRWMDTAAAAAGVMVSELLDALDWPVDLHTAVALTTAVTTDTGWLRYANTDGRALRAVSRWLDQGVRPDELFREIYQSDRPERIALLARTLAGLRLYAGGRLAVMVIRDADFAATGARADETENFVNEAMRLGSVDTAVTLVENGACVRVSLRSRGAIDVSEIAQRFGGGGHSRAAGLRQHDPIDQLASQLIEACTTALDDARE
ncbi:MAG: DHH family phosphoesterase [Phycisphaerae bacterium]|nr:DHH family phosphoesterase [Phycisphaerae bacterium]